MNNGPFCHYLTTSSYVLLCAIAWRKSRNFPKLHDSKSGKEMGLEMFEGRDTVSHIEITHP